MISTPFKVINAAIGSNFIAIESTHGICSAPIEILTDELKLELISSFTKGYIENELSEKIFNEIKKRQA